MSLRTVRAPIKGYASHLNDNGDNSNAIKDEQIGQRMPQFQYPIHMLSVNARYILGDNWRTKLNCEGKLCMLFLSEDWA